MRTIPIPALYDLFKVSHGVTTDSRNCPKGSLFIALKGSSFNGNKYAAQALESGASHVVVDEPKYLQRHDERYLLVENGLQTLQQLARYHRRQMGTKIIGITGTNGKTTTKELISAVLKTQYNILYTQGNLNNQIGVPLTLLRLTPNHELAIVEMGASHPGDIRELVEIAEPDFGLITNVGRAHLEGFGSFEHVIQTKGELYDYLRKTHATAFIHADNPYLKEMAAGLSRVWYSTSAANKDKPEISVYGELTAASPLLSLVWQQHGDMQRYSIDTRLIGDYNLENVLAAITIGVYFKIPPQNICQGISQYKPGNNRSQFEATPHNHLIIDAYNANPTSMQAALQNFARLQASPKAVILGDMKELGNTHTEEHRAVIRFVREAGIDLAIFIGNEFGTACKEEAEAGKTGSPDHRQVMEFYPDTQSLIEDLRKGKKIQGYTILIKGSNSMKLYELPKEL